jgi:four helix bundle protein
VGTIRQFEDIEAWQKARLLVKFVYDLSRAGEFSRDYVLRGQIRRAAVSVMSNIAEGFERSGNKEFLRFLAMAKGSCGEVRSQLYVARDLGYADGKPFEVASQKAMEVSRMISGMMKHLRQSRLRGDKYKEVDGKDAV